MSDCDDTLQTGVRRLLARVLKIAEMPAGELRRPDVPSWDSLRHIELVFALEDEYGVQFEPSEFARLGSASDIVTLLRARLEA